MSTPDLPAGRELDALIAEKVMGWTRCTDVDGKTYWERVPDGVPVWQSTGLFPMPHYSTDIAAAWLVVEAFAEKGFYICVEHVHKSRNRWNAWVGDKNESAATAPLAICRAALAARLPHQEDT